jgi:hypothetical protein
MRLNSLAFRLAASAALVSIVLLVSAGILLGNLFQQAVERNFDARLLAVLDGLLANVELADDGSLVMQGALADTRFKLPLQGWYWQITPVDGPMERRTVLRVAAGAASRRDRRASNPAKRRQHCRFLPDRRGRNAAEEPSSRPIRSMAVRGSIPSWSPAILTNCAPRWKHSTTRLCWC